MTAVPAHLLDDVRIVGGNPNPLPYRPKRDIASPLANPTIRLSTIEDLERDLLLRNTPGCVVIDATPVVEMTDDGSELEAMPGSGLTLSEETRSRGMMVIGATGSGKTYSVGAGAFEATLRDTTESAIRVNLKGPKGTAEDIALIKELRSGCPVFVFAPGHPERSRRFNALEYARRHRMTETLLKAVVDSQARGRDETAFWAFLAEKTLRLLFAEPNITSLVDIHRLFSDPQSLSAFATRVNNPSLIEYARFASEGSNGATSFGDIGARIAAFAANENVAAVSTGTNQLDMLQLLTQGQPFVLIIECDESTFFEAKYLIGAFVSLFLDSALQVAERSDGRLPIPVNLFLDEFGVIPPLPAFAAKANLYRSRGVRFVVFVQSLQQLLPAYGAEAESLIAAFNTKVFLCSGLHMSDREYASRLGGNIVVHEWRESQQRDADGQWVTSSRTSQSVQRPLLSVEDFNVPKRPDLGMPAFAFRVDQPPLLAYFTAAWKLPIFAKIVNPTETKPRSGKRKPPPVLKEQKPIPALTLVQSRRW